MKEIDKTSPLFKWDAKVEMGELIPMSLQHVAAMIVGCVTPAIIVSGICKLSPADSVVLVQSCLIVSGIAIFLQIFPLFNHLIGSGLPVIMGTSFAYLPTLISIGKEFNLATILGSQLIGAVVAIIFGLFVSKLRKLFPPLVTGTVVFTIGLSLYPTAINYMAGGTGSPTYGQPINWIIAFITLAVVIYLNNFTKGFLKLASILIGIIVGYVVSLFFGIVDFSSVGTAGWFMVPAPMHFGMEFHAAPIITMVVLFVVNSVQAIGDLSATSLGGEDRQPEMKELSGGIVASGLGSIIGAVFGGLPIATYSQNVGIVSTNKVINRRVFMGAAIIIVLAGVLPKLSAILTTIPRCVLGGATVSVFASITMTGIKLFTQQELTFRTSTIIGLSVALGIGLSQVPASLAVFPSWVTMVFGSSPVVVATLTAILLNLLLPKDKEEEKPFKEDEAKAEEAYAEGTILGETK